MAPTPKIILDPEQILISDGFDQGEYITYFNFLNKQLGSQSDFEIKTLIIKAYPQFRK